MLKNGKKVTTAKMWWNQRRPEIVEVFDREIYGRVPKNVPKVKWEVSQHHEGKERRRAGHHQAAGRARRQFGVPGDHGRYSSDADHAGQRQGSGAGDDGVRRRSRPSAAAAAAWRGPAEGRLRKRPGRAHLAAAGSRQGLGLRAISPPAAFRPTTARA